jgi:hypothetical protein
MLDEMTLPPLDAGANGSTSEGGLPPLDAGAAGSTYKEPEPDMAPDPVSDEPVDEPVVKDTPAEDSDDEQSPILKSLLEGEDSPAQTPAIPEGVTSEEWATFQAWRAAQGQPQMPTDPKPDSTESSLPSTFFELSDEEFDAAFDSKDGLSKILGKVHDAHTKQLQAQQAQFQQVLGDVYAGIMANAEQMVYLNDVFKENPEIAQYERQLKIALDLAKQQKPGDLYEQVQEAVAMLKSDLGKFEKIKSTKRVDVRPKQNAPRHSGSSPRTLNSGGKQEAQPGGLDFLAKVIGR